MISYELSGHLLGAHSGLFFLIEGMRKEVSRFWDAGRVLSSAQLRASFWGLFPCPGGVHSGPADSWVAQGWGDLEGSRGKEGNFFPNLSVFFLLTIMWKNKKHFFQNKKLALS